jgi:hypothetical protein
MRFFSILLIVILLSACSGGRKGIKLPDYEKMLADTKQLSADEIEELQELFLDLEPAVYEFFEKPEYLLYGYLNENSKTPDIYSIFIAEGYIYVGDYFIAWADRMKGRTTRCYKMDEYTAYVLENLK